METARTLLVVDDDAAVRQVLVSLFRDRGFRVWEAGLADAALELAREVDFEVVLTDVRMPGRSGVELLGELRGMRPDTPVLVMTAFGSTDSAIEAMRAGAFDYIAKPFEPDVVMFAVDRALKQRALEAENRRLRRAVARSGASELEPQDLPLGSVAPPSPAAGLLRAACEQRLPLREVEERYIEEILRLTGGNKVRAARILGIDRKTLYRRAERSARGADA